MLTLEIGTTLDTTPPLTITGAALAKGSHKYWIVTCECGREANVRGTSLRRGAYTCRCSLQPSAAEPSSSVEQRLSAILEELAQLRKLLEAAPAAPAKQPGLKNHSLDMPKRVPYSKAQMLDGATTPAERQARMQTNRTAILDLLAHDISVRNTDLIRDRLVIENDDAQFDPDPASQAARLRTIATQVKQLQ